MQLELSPREYEVVADVLRRSLQDLREEIYKTETAAFEAQLKERRSTLAGVLERLEAATAED
jgi:hypothetical protein